MRTVQARVGDTTVSVDVPDGLEATAVADGLAIRPRDADSRRTVSDMRVTLGAGVPAGPALNRTRGTGADAIRYHVAREGGGSGGEEVTLHAERACGARVVRLRFDTQAEGDADLEPAFAVLASARCSAG